MTPEGIRAAITASIKASWTTTPIQYQNHVFNEPNTAWIRPVVKMAETMYGELGSDGVGLRQGILLISIFDLIDSGTKRSLDYANTLENLFRRREVGGVIFDEPTTDVIGKDENGYYHTLIEIGFYAWIGE